MNHFVDDGVFEEILRFLHKFGVKADVPGLVIAAFSLGFHALEEVTRHMHLQFGPPFFDEHRHELVQQSRRN